MRYDVTYEVRTGIDGSTVKRGNISVDVPGDTDPESIAVQLVYDTDPYADDRIDPKVVVTDVEESEGGAFTLRFRPEAWINDYAVEVDAEGPRTWQPSAEYTAELATVLTDDPSADLDFLRDDPAAPRWVREWHGPFTVEVIDGTPDAE